MNRKLKILIFSIFLIGFLGALTYADIIPVDDYDFMWEYSLFNVTNITVDKITAKDWGNWSGRLGQIENSYDTNASDCEDEDYLDGDTTCKNFNNTVLDITKSTSYNATTIETLEGTYDTGDIDSILIARDGDSYNVSEDAGASPLLIEVNFSGVDDFNSIVMRLLYIGGVGHEVEICLWDYTLADWECEYGEITDMEIFAFSNTNVLDATDHINVTEGGKVILRFDHVQSGIGTHDFALDFISLVDGFATITTPKHNSLSGRDDTSNHPWALAADGSRIGENITVDNFNTTGNVNLSDVLYIDADGEVGIGTLNPNGLFEIAGKIFIEDWSNATDLDAAGDVADDSHDHSSVGSTVTIAAADIVDTDAGTDITADLEEEVTEGSLADSTIISADIKDDVIVEADLNAIDAAGDEECLTFEGDTSNFEWQTCGAGGVGGGTGLPIWIDGTTSLYINKTYSELLNVSAVNTTSVNTTDLLVTNYIEGKGTADFKILQSSDWTNGTFTRSQITNAYDTNASTECATEEVLLGNASCMDIEGNEWINPGEIADVDDADIETDLNTYVDIGGDTMIGDLIVQLRMFVQSLNLTQVGGAGKVAADVNITFGINQNLLFEDNSQNDGTIAVSAGYNGSSFLIEVF